MPPGDAMHNARPDPEALRRVEARVHGRVQGVGYRAFVVSRARGLGLGGYVRNCRDGTVEVVAVGEESDLEELVRHLQRGPLGSRVDRVETRFGDEQVKPPLFEVGR